MYQNFWGSWIVGRKCHTIQKLTWEQWECYDLSVSEVPPTCSWIWTSCLQLVMLGNCCSLVIESWWWNWVTGWTGLLECRLWELWSYIVNGRLLMCVSVHRRVTSQLPIPAITAVNYINNQPLTTNQQQPCLFCYKILYSLKCYAKINLFSLILFQASY